MGILAGGQRFHMVRDHGAQGFQKHFSGIPIIMIRSVWSIKEIHRPTP